LAGSINWGRKARKKRAIGVEEISLQSEKPHTIFLIGVE
jgi:hypothetical protein